MSTNQKLKDKIAVITGGNSGIGLATAKRFVAEGAYVFITGRRQPELDAAVKSIGENVTGIQGDVSKLGDLDRIYASVKEQKGRIDVLFANAGLGSLAPLSAVTTVRFATRNEWPDVLGSRDSIAVTEACTKPSKSWRMAS